MTDDIRMSAAQTIRVVSATADALDVESTWQPGGKKPPTHWHPQQHEHFEVLAGELTARIGDDDPRVFQAGEEIDVPPRTPHSMWNAGSEVARASWRVTPALGTEEMFRYIGRGRSPIRDVWMLLRFRREFRLGKP